MAVSIRASWVSGSDAILLPIIVALPYYEELIIAMVYPSIRS